MKFISVVACLVSGFHALAQLPKASSGQIIRFENFKSKYAMPRNVDVWIPENYTPSKKYAVIYMHDGQMLFDSTITWNHQEWMVDETLARLMNENPAGGKQGEITECIVAGIWSNGPYRHAEYFPQRVINMLPDSIRREVMQAVLNKALADDYLLFITKELKPFIDSAYSTRQDQSHTFIAGSSMGGLISLYALCEYPEVFGGAACISTHWPGLLKQNSEIPNALNKYLLQHLPSPENHHIYFDYGTATLDSMYEEWQKMIDVTMTEKGYTDKNWITMKFAGVDHSEHSWQKRFCIPMKFLLGIK
ncbi:MAG: alpha/beta hydrolase-fold protein [Chitinophagales bacterium]